MFNIVGIFLFLCLLFLSKNIHQAKKAALKVIENRNGKLINVVKV